MFSTNSTPCSRADFAADLHAAIALVAEECFFATAEPAGDTFLDLCAVYDEWLQATVRFHGTAHGFLQCRVPASHARALAAAFAGREDANGVSAAEVSDLAGELSNMVCGRWLTATHPAGLFDLSRPSVEPCRPPDAEWQGALLDDAPLAVWVMVLS